MSIKVLNKLLKLSVNYNCLKLFWHYFSMTVREHLDFFLGMKGGHLSSKDKKAEISRLIIQ